jgi:Nucleotidyltransferase domain.
MADDQIKPLLGIVNDVLGDDVIGVYLFGSAVLGGLRPHSDIDVMVVSERPTTRPEKQRLITRLMDLSGKPRHLELTIVLQSEIRPWRYPPRMDLQYGDRWRKEFESSDLEPWGSSTNPDLASLVTMVLLADTPLEGPPPAEVLDPVPRRDFVAAQTHGLDGLLQDLESDTRNVVLTLARIWSSIVTDEVRSKDAAADWALPLLPAKYQPVLTEARAIYLGEQEEESETFQVEARSFAELVVAEIKRSAD